MRFQNVLRMGEEYAKFAILLLIAVAVIFCLAYFVIYKKCMHGTKSLKVKNLLSWAVLLGYVLVVLCATLLSRAGGGYSPVNLHLFDSYMQAWQGMDMADWRNLILNIAMFVPFGFLLPLVVKKCRAFWKTALCGLIFSGVIEGIQYLTGRGVCEADDLLNNTVGAMIGYGLAYLLLRLFRQKEGRKIYLFTAQIPLLAAIALFAGVFGIYDHQEYGNFRMAEKKPVSVTCEKTPDTVEETAAVYQVKRYSKDEVVAFANQILANVHTSVDEKDLDAYDDTLVCRAKGGGYHIWIDYSGLGFDYTDFNQAEDAVSKTGCSRKEIEQKLKALGITVPDQAEFRELSDGQEGTYEFKISNSETSDGKLLNGTLTCSYTTDGLLTNIENYILTYDKYKDCHLLSQTEALEQLKKGNYLYPGEMENDPAGLSLDVKQITLDYVTDSKGFYRPAWAFSGPVNGVSQTLYVSAGK